MKGLRRRFSLARLRQWLTAGPLRHRGRKGRFILPALCLALCLGALVWYLTSPAPPPDPPPSGPGTAAFEPEPMSEVVITQPTPEPAPTLTPIPEPTPTPPPEPTPAVNLAPWDDVVEHLFFHPAIVYPELAFDGDSQEKGLDDYMVTVPEYGRILRSLYDNGYILVDMNDVWTEYTDEKGALRMKRETLMIPEGKKPLILTYDDVNYYRYMRENGFTYKLIIGDDGDIWSWGLDPSGNEVISQDLDVITILDKFVRAHPDFSLNGAKGCLCLTGYEGILGYRTNTDSKDSSAEFEANRQREIEAVQPIVARLKETGWYFGCHTWGHISLSKSSLSGVKTDTDKWMAEVGALVGETKLLIYPYGARPDGSDVNQTGQIFKYYQSLGFRVFASVGSNSYSKIKTDIRAVICDRMHADGMALRHERDRYMKFFDAAEVWDDARPAGGIYTREW